MANTFKNYVLKAAGTTAQNAYGQDFKSPDNSSAPVENNIKNPDMAKELVSIPPDVMMMDATGLDASLVKKMYDFYAHL